MYLRTEMHVWVWMHVWAHCPQWMLFGDPAYPPPPAHTPGRHAIEFKRSRLTDGARKLKRRSMPRFWLRLRRWRGLWLCGLRCGFCGCWRWRGLGSGRRRCGRGRLCTPLGLPGSLGLGGRRRRRSGARACVRVLVWLDHRLNLVIIGTECTLQVCCSMCRSGPGRGAGTHAPERQRRRQTCAQPTKSAIVGYPADLWPEYWNIEIEVCFRNTL